MKPVSSDQHRTLQAWSDHIELVLAMNHAPATVTGAFVLARTIRFDLLPPIGAKLARIKALHAELAAALDAPTCTIRQSGRTLHVEIPNPSPTVESFSTLWRELKASPKSLKSTEFLLGRADNGLPQTARLSSPQVAHVLVAGTTGSGKSVLMRTIALSLALTNPPRALRFVLIDPKGTAFAPLATLRHALWGQLTTTDAALAALHRLTQELDTRRGLTQPRVAVFIDEIADLLIQDDRILEPLVRLTQRGREVGLHVIAATQKPAASILGSLAKANFPLRLCGSTTSAVDARVALGVSGSGAESNPPHCFTAAAQGRLYRFTAATADPDLDRILAHIPRAARRSRPPAPLDRLHPLQLTAPLAPAPPPVEDEDTRRARQLLEWDRWPDRWRDDRPDDYRWGFATRACEKLFDRPLEGGWARKTARILQRAEELERRQLEHDRQQPDSQHKQEVTQ